MVKIGIMKEGKVPPDARVPLSPEQCADIEKRYGNVEIIVQPSEVRCFKDEEYIKAGIQMQDDLSGCDIIMGIKEIPIDWLVSEKTYLFFSHTIKKQPYNRKLLQTILEKRIRMIDYEVITDERGVRLIAFGYYAGVVGAHNSLWTYGQRTGLFSLPRMYECYDYAELMLVYQTLVLPPVRIVLTGGGRVSSGAVKNLTDMGIRQVSPDDFLKKRFDYAVFTQLHAQDYVQHKRGLIFDKHHFYKFGEEYESKFKPYLSCTDIFINGIFYDKSAPAFFTVEEMRARDFRIKVIGDVTCDIMPDSSVPCTIRPSKITDPVYGFDPLTNAECPKYAQHGVDVMAIDNLPSELPRDASVFFGNQMIENVLPELIKGKESAIIRNGMITENGQLTKKFEYLEDYVNAVGV